MVFLKAKSHLLVWGLSSLGLLCASSVMADDTEIFFPKPMTRLDSKTKVDRSGACEAELERITSFSSLGYSVDLSTGLFNEDKVYIPVFNKSITPRWSGNLKKFILAIDHTGKSIITDKQGAPATDDFGDFTEAAVDLWSTSSSGEGHAVDKGGAAGLIDPNRRNAITDLACRHYPCQLMGNDNNRLHPNNDASKQGVITNEVMGLAKGVSDRTRLKMLNFIRGSRWNQVTGAFEPSPRMGDMLHTKPLIVTYNKDYESDVSANGQVIYAATNEGYLHAFNTVSGEEIFAFMPSSLTKNIPVQYGNAQGGEHVYGIDGAMNKHIVRDEGGKVKQALLYFGLRRGGRAYYALDVTDPADPILLWKIDAASQQALDDFSRLGQSWSTPYLAKIRTSDHDFRDVVIFSGGYDTNQDEEDAGVREANDAVGNEVFIVDALTGDLLWSAHEGGSLGRGVSNASQLTHSIPGGMRILDMNQDGAVDRLYFADVKGRVWRLELPSGPNYDLSNVNLIEFANLGQGTSKDGRMFFNEPDVALLKTGGRQWLTISLGSGYRAHPMNRRIQDRFYVLLDAAVNTPLETNLANDGDFRTLNHDDLTKVTATMSHGFSLINNGAMNDKIILGAEGDAGWFIDLPKNGEKVLSTAITSEGNVMFTTFVPEATGRVSSLGACSTPMTQGRFYSMNILTAVAGSDLNRDGTITDNDLTRAVTTNEIPNMPQRIFNKPVCENEKCTQVVDIRVGKRREALTMYDASFLENVFWASPERK